MRIFLVAIFVILVDQATKLAVVQTMHLRQSIPLIGDWLKFTFTENPGMAFGLQVGPDGFVAVLAVIATLLVIWYLYNVRHGYWPYTASLALILGGAIGNIIDRVFYGLVFEYGPLFQGRVVDFIHVDIGYVAFPEIIPIFGGSYLSLFPIWNVADMAIVGGVIGVLVFQNSFHRSMREKQREEPSSDRRQTTDTPAEPLHVQPSRLGNQQRDDDPGPKDASQEETTASSESGNGQDPRSLAERQERNHTGADEEAQLTKKPEGEREKTEQPRSVSDNSDTL